MKYFYADPLAAIWMQERFGMRFQILYFDEVINEDFSVMRSCIEYNRDPQDERWLVHPDSLHLLKPQLDDMVDGVRIGIVQEVNGDEIGVDVHGGDYDMDADSVTILQRNGIPFMWPEIEHDPI